MRYWKWHGVLCKVVTRQELLDIAEVDEWWEIEPADIYLSRDGGMKVYIFCLADKWYAVIKHVEIKY